MNLPSFPNVDLFSAGINALNGVLVARHPSHDRKYTVAGLLIMAFFGGIGGQLAQNAQQVSRRVEIERRTRPPHAQSRIRDLGGCHVGRLLLRKRRTRA